MAGRVVLLSLLLSALLAAGALPHAAAQETPRNLVIQDPAGDLGVFSLVNNPAPELMGMADIIRVEVGNEDANSYEIVLDVVGADGPVGTAGRALSVFEYICAIRFHYGTDRSTDDTGYYYRVSFAGNPLDLPHEQPSQPSYSAYYYGWGPQSSTSANIANGVTVTYEPDASLFRVHIQKAFAPAFPGPRNPGLGDHLHLESVSCFTDTLVYFSWSDTVDVDGQRYAFQGQRSDGVVSVAFVTPDAEPAAGANPWTWTPPDAGQGAPQSSVAPDETTVIPVMLTNNAETRKLVGLSVRTPGGDAEGWNITIAPSIFLAGGENRTVNLIVTPPTGAAAGSTKEIEVVAALAGEESTTVAPRTLEVIPVLGDSVNTIHLHTRPADDGGFFGSVGETLIPPFVYGASLLRDDPAWSDPEALLSPLFNNGDSTPLEPLVRPVTLDPDTPVELTVAFSGDAAETVRVRAVLYSELHGTIFSFDDTLPGDGVHTVQTYISEAGAFLPAGTQLWLDLTLGRVGFGPDTASEIRFDPRASHIVVPAAVFDDGELTLTDGTYLPTLALSAGEDRTAYLNPGKVYAYELVLANDGLETDDLVVAVNATNATGWEIDIEPGNKFRVTPGNSTPVGIAVRAPRTIDEGHKAEFVVTAQSTHDGGAYSRLRLQAIVTSGVEIDEKLYQERENQIKPLEERQGSPGPAALALLVALALVARVWRRPPSLG